MPSDLQTKFAQRIVRFFTLRRINVNTVEGKSLIDYLYTQFEQQGRFKNKEGPFYVSPRFVMDGISNFLTINPNHCITLFRDYREKRSSTSYSCANLEDAPLQKATRGLIQLLGQKHKPKFKLTKPDGAPLTPARINRTKAHTLPFNISFSPFQAPPGPAEQARRRAISSLK